MCKVEDLYNDQKVFYKTIRVGQGTGQPYYDANVTLKVSIEIDGKVVFHHKEPLSIDLSSKGSDKANSTDHTDNNSENLEETKLEESKEQFEQFADTKEHLEEMKDDLNEIKEAL